MLIVAFSSGVEGASAKIILWAAHELINCLGFFLTKGKGIGIANGFAVAYGKL